MMELPMDSSESTTSSEVSVNGSATIFRRSPGALKRTLEVAQLQREPDADEPGQCRAAVQPLRFCMENPTLDASPIASTSHPPSADFPCPAGHQTVVGAGPGAGGVAVRAKKTRGKQKINIEFIHDKNKRYTTFSKRKTGLMKKAYELSSLTGAEVMLLVASETNHVYTFATPKLRNMIQSDRGKELIQTCLACEEKPGPSQPPSSAPPAAPCPVPCPANFPGMQMVQMVRGAPAAPPAPPDSSRAVTDTSAPGSSFIVYSVPYGDPKPLLVKPEDCD